MCDAGATAPSILPLMRTMKALSGRHCCLRLLSIVLVLVGGAALPSSALAWGERGHAIIAQVAARLVVARAGRSGDQWVLQPFRDKELMLAYLSNVPDILWKDLPRDETRDLNPAHWINLEYLGVTTARDVTALTLDEAERLAKRHCETSGLLEQVACSDAANTGEARSDKGGRRRELFGVIGSAPWRVRQLSELMKSRLSQIKVPRRTGKDIKLSKASVAAAHEALTYAGLLAHFVGDLSQPLHVTADHDGYKVGLGGLHAYFESEVVAELDLDLVAGTAAQAQIHDLERLPEAAAIKGRDASSLAFMLAANSYGRIKALQDLDRDVSILRRSESRGAFRVPASRRPAAEVAPKYADFVTERLAFGAVCLAAIIWQAWQEAGAPDLSGYASFAYAIKVPPIATDYLLQARP